MHYLTNVYWNAGSTGRENQDSLLLLQVLTARGRVVLAAVCDGMGGHSKGAVAGALVTEQLQRWFYDTLLPAVRRKKRMWVIRRSVERLVYQIQSCMQSCAEKERMAMGTTMSVLVLWEKKYILWHLGDSRIYRFRKRGVGAEQMTKDHATVKGQLTKCIGSFGYFRPDSKIGVLRAGEGFLVCSDGFWRRIKEEELADVLAPERIKEEAQIARRLKELAICGMRRGEHDNLSAVYVRAV